MSQSGAYSESKMIWWAHREGFPPDGPKQVHWILSDLCNQDCHFCAYRMSGYSSNELFSKGAELSAYGHDNPKRWIPTDRALRLLDEFKAVGVRALQFTGGGEPTVHPDHEEIFSKALEMGFQCALVSNGYRWRDRIFDLLPRFTWVRVSVDAGTASTYARVRRTTEQAWFKVWENVGRLVRETCRLSPRPYIGLGYVVTPDSWQEMEEFAEIASESCVDNIRLTAMFSNDDERPFLPVYDQIVEAIRRIKDRHGKNMTIHDNFGSRFEDLSQKHPDYDSCPYQYYTTYVGGDLNVYRCCILAYNTRGLVKGGDLRFKRFDEWWQSEERKQDMAYLNAKECPRCQFNAKNREMLYVIGSTYSGPAVHVEFP